jgi:protein-tyrosine phosphatase
MEVDDANFFPEDKVRKSQNYENTASLSLPLELPRTHSPESLRTPSYPSPLSFPIANARVRDKSRSLPLQAAQNSLSASGFRSPRRADTLPAAVDHNVGFVSVEHCAERLQSTSDRVLLLDVRPYPQFCQANITGSLNLCIPTTLLKRPSFNTQKLEDTFVGESEKRMFATWKESTHIIAYDFNTAHLRDAASLTHILKKFTVEGWNGKALILRGGFSAFASQFPDQIRRQQQAAGPTGVNAAEPPCKNLTLPSAALIAGGCILPDAAVANPFFGNIRQNMDLLDGVGQLALSLPEGLTESKRDRLPSWLRLASESEDKGHVVSDRFLTIEKRELERMREALSSNTAYGSGVRQGPVKFRVAGIEKGSKNRYNDIYPFDHSRVRLQDIPSGGCDYVNANYIKAEHASKSYIATQAPVPDTFTDFWRVVWEQDIRVIVALTAEVERGLVKCHRYWNSGDYGPFKLKALAERRVPMDSSKSHQNSLPSKRPKPLKRRATDPPTIGEKPAAQASDPTGETPYITIRHFTLSHSAFPFQPIREITQLQYSYWPDLGTTSQPVHLVKLIDQCNRIAKASVNSSSGHQVAQPERQRPTLVHCSAGCGRTGTFCTVDSVMDTLERWQAERRVRFQRGINGDRQKNTPGWIHDDNVDLVAKTVEDFRTQRPSMVQNLTQFVLCYESVLVWLVSQMDDASL